MKILIITFLIFFFFGYSKGYGQLSTKEPPISFDLKKNLSDIEDDSIQIVTMPALDMKKIEAEDLEDEEYDMPPRFGFPHKVNYNLTNSGTWTELPNGDRLWRLNVICPNALSVNFCFDRFWIPKGGKLFVYSKDRRHYIGAFTSNNNKGDVNHIRGFATGLVYGNDVVLEYYQPKEVTVDAIISLDYIVHGYRYIHLNERGFGDAASCMVNINCEEGQNWQNEKIAIAMILVNGHRFCSGSLINTTDFSQKPFFLTANHCISDYGDAEGNTNLYYYSFYWNYEAPGCVYPTVEPAHANTSGASIVANNPYSDFALLRLMEDPKNLPNFTPYYLGWDNTGISGDPGVCIHHPRGDVKKISTVDGLPISSGWSGTNNNSHWSVGWESTLNGHGMTQGGSSGSPLLNGAHRVIGQLHGSNCNNCTNPNGHSKYGKFNVSWTGNSSGSIQRRLNCWLDSLNTGTQTMDGLLLIQATSTIDTDKPFYGSIHIADTGQLTIQSNVEIMSNGCIFVDGNGKLVIDGGKLSNAELVLKPGASLQIVNGGIIETRSGLVAPLGVSVEIDNGQIL